MSSAQRQRDEALARISRARRWLLAGSGALTVGIAALVSAVAPGRTLARSKPRTTKASTQPATTAPRLTMPPLASASQLGLQPPGAPPQAASSPSTTPTPPPQAQTSAPTAPAPSSGSGGAVSGGS